MKSNDIKSYHIILNSHAAAPTGKAPNKDKWGGRGLDGKWPIQWKAEQPPI